MLQWIQNAMSYPGIAFAMFLENVFPPLPSELIMPLAGYTAAQGKLSLWLVILAGTIGSVIGQLPLYYLGKIVGQERLKAWADRHGQWLALSGEDVDSAKSWFDNHGSKAVLLGRLIPGVRSLISVPAGVAGMNLPKFLLYSAIGTGLWAGILAYLGSLLGEKHEIVNRYIGPATYFILGGIAVGMAVGVVKRRKKRAAEQGPQEAAKTGAEPRQAAP